MNPGFTEKDYTRIEGILQDIKNASHLCSDEMYRLSNGFSKLADSTNWISERYFDGLNGWALSAILRTATESDNISIFDTTRFKRGIEETEENPRAELEETFDSFTEEAADLIKDLEHVKEMVNTSLQFINTALKKTKEIENLAKDGKKYLKEKDKHDPENHNNRDLHS